MVTETEHRMSRLIGCIDPTLSPNDVPRRFVSARRVIAEERWGTDEALRELG